MDPKDRIIFPLDVPNIDEAQSLVDELHDYVGSFKIGLEFIFNLLAMLLTGPESEALTTLTKARNLFNSVGVKGFGDVKFLDILNTVLGAARGVSRLKMRMFNVHCLGGMEMMAAARRAADEYAATSGLERPLVLGVTILTSLTWDDLRGMGFNLSAHQQAGDHKNLLKSLQQDEVRAIVATLAKRARVAGLDGVVSSPQEIVAIREGCGPHFRIVTPNTAPSFWSESNEQNKERAMTVEEAIVAGADELVIGRAIRKPPKDIGSPVEAAKRVAGEIEEALQTLEAKRRG